MIPNYIDEEDPRRNGERMVFDWFSDNKVPGTAYYSLLQKNHKHKLIGEVDFLYVSERGFLCIEVKGGQEIYRKDGRWFSVNRRGEHNEIKNPFVQAKDCRYALQNYFEALYGKNSKQANYLMGYAVIFPECVFTGRGNDLVTEVMFDANSNLEEFPSFLKKVYDYWEKLELTRHNSIKTKLSGLEIRQANDLLRSDFYVVPSMHLELQNAEKKMIQLTDDQYDILDTVADNPRTIVSGAAGTGKSLLALELTRKYAAKGNNTLYLCYNSNMAEYAKMSLDKCPNTRVSTFHALLMSFMEDDVPYNMPVSEISNIFLSKVENVSDKFTAIVIDEGQDLLSEEVLLVIDEQLLVGGLAKGKWTIFLDSNQNIFNSDDEYERTLDILKDEYHAMSLLLQTNCRNTEPIASQTAVLTDTKPAKNLKLKGYSVKTLSYSNKKNFLSLFKKEINSLLSSGISASDIVILSRYKHNNLRSQLSGITEVCNLEIIERDSVRPLGKKCLNYYTVQAFKGLESKIVLYIDVDGFNSIQDRRWNYVAMSRACLYLYVFYDESKRQEYLDAMVKGLENLRAH